MTTRALVEAALVGTARQADRALAALAVALPVDELLASTGDAMPLERRLLLAAAVNDAYARAGRAATSGVATIAPAPGEARPVCGPAAASLIGELIAPRPRHLLREALERLDAAGAIVAPSLLPELLDTRDELLATVLPRVIGERGRWLATLTGDGDWMVVDTPDDEEARRLWNEGPHARRVAGERPGLSRNRPIALLRSWLLEQRLVEQSVLDRIHAELTTEMDAAVDFAVNAPYPDPDKVGQDVYA